MVSTTTMLPQSVLLKIEAYLKKGYTGRITLHVQNGQIRKIESTEFAVVE